MHGSANKLKTARKISLTGDVSGSVNFDGAGDVTINTTQNNIAVLEGNVNVLKTDAVNVYQQTIKTINYPEGYNKNNCVCVALGTTTDVNSRGFSYDGSESTANASVGMLVGNPPKAVQLVNSNMSLKLYNITSSDKLIYYKIVLMKIA